jgi:hypothetical protein
MPQFENFNDVRGLRKKEEDCINLVVSFTFTCTLWQSHGGSGVKDIWAKGALRVYGILGSHGSPRFAYCSLIGIFVTGDSHHIVIICTSILLHM